MSYLVLGAGLMGRALVHDLIVNSSIEDVTVVDIDGSKLEELEGIYGKKGLSTKVLDVTDKVEATKVMKVHQVLINATSYNLNVGLTKLAIENGCHMLDLGGNMPVVKKQLAMASDATKAGILVLPNCGLAPGMANVLGAWLLKRFEQPKGLKIFVGGLPVEPSNPPWNYMKLFSPLGLVNEYVEMADAIENGKVVQLDPMQDLEKVVFPEPFGELEAFNTSGGTSLMVENLKGKLETLYYKTLRYPGHCEAARKELDKMATLDEDNKRKVASKFDGMFSSEGLDATLMQIEATGKKDGKERRVMLRMVDRADKDTGMSSMMRTTAFPTSIMAQMMIKGEIRERGVHTPEMVVEGERLVEEMETRDIKCNIY
jgi:lysine 6-dehydrogenase